MRAKQQIGQSGSLKWIQKLIRDKPELLDRLFSIQSGELIAWLSPIEEDQYAEYRDSSFIQRLEITALKYPLTRFWPSRGPQWDALGRSGSGKLFLVEAKAHIAELFSGTTGAKDAHSVELIHKSLNAAKEFYKARADANWLSPFYQFTNRLAHLYFLRELNGLDAHLVFVYFINDNHEAKRCPKSQSEWEAALFVLNEAIGMTGKLPEDCVHKVFVDVNELL